MPGTAGGAAWGVPELRARPLTTVIGRLRRFCMIAAVSLRLLYLILLPILGAATSCRKSPDLQMRAAAAGPRARIAAPTRRT